VVGVVPAAGLAVLATGPTGLDELPTVELPGVAGSSAEAVGVIPKIATVNPKIKQIKVIETIARLFRLVAFIVPYLG
jgi:hypothetical protein